MMLKLMIFVVAVDDDDQLLHVLQDEIVEVDEVDFEQLHQQLEDVDEDVEVVLL